MDVDKERRGIQSVEVGGQLLLALAEAGKPMMLKDLARAASMPPAKAHPYLVSFGKIGLIDQDPLTSRYTLGPLALRLGLISLQLLDPVREAQPAIEELAEKVGQTVVLSVWGNMGPTIIRMIESNNPIHVNLRPGTVMPLINSATGRVFAAFMPQKAVERLIQGELQRLAGVPPEGRPSWKRIEDTLQEVRRHGLSRAVGQLISGINGIAAPVFDHTNNMVLAITALGPVGTFNADWDGPIAQAVREAAQRVSARLGHVPARAREDAISST